MQWRIHQGLAPDRIAELVQVVSDFGDELQLVSGPLRDLPPWDGHDGLAIALTTLQDARHLTRTWRGPGLYFDLRKYDTSYWMPRIDLSLAVLNRGGVFVPAGVIDQLRIPLASMLGSAGLFVRPDSGLKPFPGFLVPVADCRSWQDVAIAFQREAPHQDPERLVYISPGRRLAALEWRFWIVDRQVVASTPYSWEEGAVPWQSPPAPAQAIAERVAANRWQPDVAYTVDVVEASGEYLPFYLNEINAVSTSGLYGVDFSALFQALRSAVIAEDAGDLTVVDE